MTLRRGNRVQTRSVVAFAFPEPLRAWSSGYRFVRLEGADAIVVHLEGLYAGLEARYPIADVRLAPGDVAVRVTAGAMIGACGTLVSYEEDGRARVRFVGAPDLLCSPNDLDTGVPAAEAFPGFRFAKNEGRKKR